MILVSLKMTASFLSFASLSSFRVFLAYLFGGICIEICDVLSSATKKKKEKNKRREAGSDRSSGKLELVRAPLRSTATANRFLNVLPRRCNFLFSLSLSTRTTSQLLGTSTELALTFCSLTQALREKCNRAERYNS